jgi:hypothetical protein
MSGDQDGGARAGMTPPDRKMLRTAFEALRAGVPNRAAVLLLGSVEDAIEQRFEAGLDAVWSDAPAPGLLFAGGFGTGKSHLLGFLREMAVRKNFVVSTVAISKETPLSAAPAVFSAALRDTIVPSHADDAMTVALAELQRRPEALADLALRARAPESGLGPVFAAILHLLGRQLPTDLLYRLENFLAGGKAPGPQLRQALQQAGGRGMFELGSMTDATLAPQRERFVPLLFRAAGFAGWCVLFDEIELIGRYAAVQRARAYAELGRWLGFAPGAGRIAGLLVAGAITDDFASEVIAGRQDDTKLPERLRLKGLPGQADLAQGAMRAIGAAPVLHPPLDDDLRRHAETLRRGYAMAYGWAAPPALVAERRANRTMRHHIRGWIAQWDVLRLQGRAAGLEHDTIAPNYAETPDLDEAFSAAGAPEDDDRR